MSRLSTPLRLRVAAALCLLPLGLVWSANAGFHLPGTYSPGVGELGAQAPARLFLVVSAAVFAVAAARPRTQATKRAVQAAVGSLGVALALALAARATAAGICVAGALALVVPLARPRNPGVFGRTALRR